MKAGSEDTLRRAPTELEAHAADPILVNATIRAEPHEKADPRPSPIGESPIPAIIAIGADTRIDLIATARDATARVPTGTVLRCLNENLERQAKRIAQALHDEAGQLLAAAHMAIAETARDLPAPARERLRAVDSHLDGIEEQLRRLAHELRPRILDDLGLVPALEFLAESFGKRRDISVAVYGALNRLPAVVETTIYRVVHEALTNVGKHSRATHVGIVLSQTPGMLLCTIDDDGVGFDATSVLRGAGERGFGLAGACDQITALGGTMRINSGPGAGTDLVISIPLEE